MIRIENTIKAANAIRKNETFPRTAMRGFRYFYAKSELN
jgi:hypothetical protein